MRLFFRPAVMAIEDRGVDKDTNLLLMDRIWVVKRKDVPEYVVRWDHFV